jgi:Holliday junction DNA helicase RuvA
MITFLRGDFVYKTPAQIHMDVGGVGYEVQISLHTFSQLQHLDRGILHIYHQVKEDDEVLFGFFETSEKEMFIQLISVSGVGASTARMMLSSMKPEELASAIVQGQENSWKALRVSEKNRRSGSCWSFGIKLVKNSQVQIFPH